MQRFRFHPGSRERKRANGDRRRQTMKEADQRQKHGQDVASPSVARSALCALACSGLNHPSHLDLIGHAETQVTTRQRRYVLAGRSHEAESGAHENLGQKDSIKCYKITSHSVKRPSNFQAHRLTAASATGGDCHQSLQNHYYPSILILFF